MPGLFRALAIASLLLPAAALAEEAKPEGSADQEKKVCKRFEETGSLVKKKKVCMTQRQWREYTNNSQANAREFQTLINSQKPQ